MPLPGSRDYDAVDAGPLPAATVNNIQDGIVGHESELRKQYKLSLSIYAGQPDVETHGIYDVSESRYIVVNASLTFAWAIPLREGDRIVSLKCFVEGAGVTVKNLNLYKRADAAAATAATLLDNQPDSTSGAFAMTLVLGGGGELIGADETFWAEFTPGEVGDDISHLIVTYDRP